MNKQLLMNLVPVLLLAGLSVTSCTQSEPSEPNQQKETQVETEKEARKYHHSLLQTLKT